MTPALDVLSHPIEKLVAIARENEQVQLDLEALEHIKICNMMLWENLPKKRPYSARIPVSRSTWLFFEICGKVDSIEMKSPNINVNSLT